MVHLLNRDKFVYELVKRLWIQIFDLIRELANECICALKMAINNFGFGYGI